MASRRTAGSSSSSRPAPGPAGPAPAARVEAHAFWPARGVAGPRARREHCHYEGPHPGVPGAGARRAGPRPARLWRAERGRASPSARGGLYGRAPLLQSLAGAGFPRRPGGLRHRAAGEALGPRHATAGEAPLDGRAAPLRRGRVCDSHRRSVDGYADTASLRHEHDHNERPSLGHEAAPPLRRRLRGHRRPAGPAARPARPLALGPCRDGELRHAEAVTNDRPRCSRVRLEPALRGHGACEAAVSLPNPDDDGRHRPVACESRKSTAVEQACPLRVQELLAVLYALRALRH